MNRSVSYILSLSHKRLRKCDPRDKPTSYAPTLPEATTESTTTELVEKLLLLLATGPGTYRSRAPVTDVACTG